MVLLSVDNLYLYFNFRTVVQCFVLNTVISHSEWLKSKLTDAYIKKLDIECVIGSKCSELLSCICFKRLIKLRNLSMDKLRNCVEKFVVGSRITIHCSLNVCGGLCNI